MAQQQRLEAALLEEEEEEELGGWTRLGPVFVSSLCQNPFLGRPEAPTAADS